MEFDKDIKVYKEIDIEWAHSALRHAIRAGALEKTGVYYGVLIPGLRKPALWVYQTPSMYIIRKASEEQDE